MISAAAAVVTAGIAATLRAVAPRGGYGGYGN